MQELFPIEFFAILGVMVFSMILFTYYGFKVVFKHSAASFNRPGMSTLIGIYTFLFIGIFLGIFVMMALYTGALSIGPELDWLFNNEHTIIFVTALIVAFTIPLGYLYIYRGGS